MNLSRLFSSTVIFLFFVPIISGQNKANFLFTKADKEMAIITMGSTTSAQCTVIEYPEFLVVLEIPRIPIKPIAEDSKEINSNRINPLISFIDSVYSGKPIEYILNSHHHSHSLSLVTPFLEKGAKLVTSKANIETYNKRELFGSKASTGYSDSVIQISSDTVLLADSNRPIEVLYLKKSDYASIPTETFLFFNFPKQKLLAASCMVYLKDFNEKYGFKGLVYNNRLRDVNKIIGDKKLTVENTLQLFRLRSKNDRIMPPIFPISYFHNVLKHSWHRWDLSEHFQNMSYDFLTTKKDSILNYLGENDIYQIVLNHAVYQLIEKKEYKKAVALAHILVIFEPGNLNEIDTLGEAYYNNGQLEMAIHYDSVIKRLESKPEGLGILEWEKNQKNRLDSGS